MPWRSHTARTSRRFSRRTGWPPPLLFVTVTMKTETARRRRRAISASSLAASRFPLNGWIACGSPPRRSRGRRPRAPVLDVGARRVEVLVAGDDLARPAHQLNRILGCPPLVGGHDVREPVTAPRPPRERVPAPAPRRTTRRRGSSPPTARCSSRDVPLSVSRSMITSSGVDLEQVEVGRLKIRLALVARGELDRLDHLDLERLDDRPREVHGNGG